jgi:pimeloyl-ACP methyl ester carboxylesterase
MIIDSDGAHVAADFYGLQDLLALRGRRTCIFDKPGLGWSDYYYASQNMDPLTWYHSFLTTIPERPPFILIGWGGGGPVVWSYSNKHPEMVVGLGFLDTCVFLGFEKLKHIRYGDGIEWRVQQYLKNLTETELLELRAQDISSRNKIFALIRALGVPWGIIEFLLPTDPCTNSFLPVHSPFLSLFMFCTNAWYLRSITATFFPPQKYSEYHWYYVTAKTWVTQYFFLRTMLTAKLSQYWLGAFNQSNPSLDGVPLVHVISYLSDADICNNAKVPLDSKECKDLVKVNQFMKREQIFLSSLTGNGTVLRCTESTCNQRFPVNKANWTADQLIKSFP